MDRHMRFFRRLVPAATVIACLAFGLLIPACSGSGPGSDSGKGTAAMNRSIPKTIPPIDAAVPAKTETASFALG
jgi:hypothetical protein